MEEEGKITVRDALEITIRLLEDIRVPVALAEQVMIPICQAVDNLKACVKGISKPEEEETDGRDGEAQ